MSETPLYDIVRHQHLTQKQYDDSRAAVLADWAHLHIEHSPTVVRAAEKAAFSAGWQQEETRASEPNRGPHPAFAMVLGAGSGALLVMLGAVIAQVIR